MYTNEKNGVWKCPGVSEIVNCSKRIEVGGKYQSEIQWNLEQWLDFQGGKVDSCLLQQAKAQF